jgi:hypothetical protein
VRRGRDEREGERDMDRGVMERRGVRDRDLDGNGMILICDVVVVLDGRVVRARIALLESRVVGLASTMSNGTKFLRMNYN